MTFNERVRAVSACLLAVPLLASAVRADDEWRGSEVERDGVVHVMNPAEGMTANAIVEATEVWRLGAADDALFATISTVLRDGHGTTYMLDARMNTVHVVDPAGLYAGTIGREGEGPAEFRMPSGMAFLSDSTLCVSQVMPARAVMMSTGGEAEGDFPLPDDDGTPYVNGFVGTDLGPVFCFGRLLQGDTSVELRTSFERFGAGARDRVVYWEMTQSADFANVEFDEKTDASPVWAVSDEGRFFINNDWDAYAVEVVGPEGATERVIERVYTHRPRDRRETDVIRDQIERGEISPDTKVSTTSRDVERIVPRSDGTVWVLSSRGARDLSAGTVATFDEFDASGRFVRQVVVKGPFKAGRDDFRIVDDLLFVVVNGGERGGEDTEDGGEVEVICLRLEPTS